MATTSRRKDKRVITDAVVHITATFNNTIITFSDRQGNVIAWATTGSAGFKGARKSTPYAAQVTAESVGRRAQEMGVQNLDVCVRGVGSGRDSSVRALNALGFRISSIRDMTPMPHNGCRAPKRRRV
ncbi:MAG: 30S ribosomal protein S11 [Candidatus Zeuxoniibacter abyssi]|nr:MAG: 30S ribosomal protein S11 [Candidatus Persebacteraceae bacterium AB1(2)]